MKLTTFNWVPPFATGYVCDFRIRWALEEAKFPYTIELVNFEDVKTPAYRKRQPFGQVVCFEDGNVQMFETGAILIYLAEKSEALMSKDAQSKARSLSWILAALNTIEPHVDQLNVVDGFCQGQEWAKLRRPAAVENLHKRLNELSVWLGSKEYLEDKFTAGDLMVASVLRKVDDLSQFPTLKAYVERCTARPAFKKALADQLQTHIEHAPKN